MPYSVDTVGSNTTPYLKGCRMVLGVRAITVEVNICEPNRILSYKRELRKTSAVNGCNPMRIWNRACFNVV